MITDLLHVLDICALNPCQNPNPCSNKGACTDTTHGIMCECSPGFKGKFCERK